MWSVTIDPEAIDVQWRLFQAEEKSAWRADLHAGPRWQQRLVLAVQVGKSLARGHSPFQDALGLDETVRRAAFNDDACERQQAAFARDETQWCGLSLIGVESAGAAVSPKLFAVLCR